MLTKNKIFFTFIFFLYFSVFNINLFADEFNISAKEISIDKQNNIVIGDGNVEISDSEGKVIKANKVIYEKSKEFLTVEGDVKIYDTDGNLVKTNKATYDKPKELINTYKSTELSLSDGYKIVAHDLIYDNQKKVISSNKDSILTDLDNNYVSVSMFRYSVEKNLFSSIGKIKIIDSKKNKYSFKELHVDTKKKEMVGSDVSVLLDKESFGVNDENDPRFVANDIYLSEKKSNLSKAVFTICKERPGECPPWSLRAKKISHDKIKKTIYYEHATLKFYDIPIFYFPKFFHPDPTVKRQSGFLFPFFTESTAMGTGFGLPYYWAISNDKDLTFTPKFYGKENMLFLNEYRQAFKNSFLTLDTSYTAGYKNTSSTKTDGSRNHIFGELDINLSQDQSYQSDISFKVQKTSNDTYFRVHDINTALVDSDNTDLENKVSYNFRKDDVYFNLTGTVYEDLRENTNSRYEYILPNILFGKSFFTEKFGTIDFKTNAVYKNYKVNKHTTILTNDIIWAPNSYISKNGFVNTLEGLIKNTNYEAKNTTDYKTVGTINELSSVLSFKTSLPMKKQGNGFYNTFSPTFMARYAPGHMRNLSTDDISLKYANLFSTNKTSVIEDGLSAIIGFDFKTNKTNKMGIDQEKLTLSMGQVFRKKINKDMPAKSSLDQKMSDVVGEINYNFSEIGKIEYKFAVDHNFNDINYNEISTSLNFNKVEFNLNYLEEQNHVGKEHYANAGLTLNVNDNNKLSFETRKNFRRDSTELYDISYQYVNDCLTAGLVFRREFYEDSDVEPKDTLMFQIRFIPLTGINTPALNP